MKLNYFRITILFVLMNCLGCENYREKQITDFIGQDLQLLQLLHTEENLDEFSGDRYFISYYRISEADLNWLARDRTFSKLTDIDKISQLELRKQLKADVEYSFKHINQDSEENYVIVNPSEPIIIFAKFKPY